MPHTSNTASVGITGTTRGMTVAQRGAVERLLATLPGDRSRAEFHHGDCVGADEEAERIASDLGYWTVAHPDTDADGRAYTPSSTILQEDRAKNRVIVDAVGLLIGCPATDQEWPGSGTWFTINYALASGTPVYAIGPTGRILHDTRPGV